VSINLTANKSYGKKTAVTVEPETGSNRTSKEEISQL
jgi:hypothetical protein